MKMITSPAVYSSFLGPRTAHAKVLISTVNISAIRLPRIMPVAALLVAPVHQTPNGRTGGDKLCTHRPDLSYIACREGCNEMRYFTLG